MNSIRPTGAVVIDHNVIADRLTPIERGCRSVVDDGKVFANPSFIDYASRGLRLHVPSPVLDVALPDWSPGDDFDRRSRPQGAGPDVGAFELPHNADS